MAAFLALCGMWNGGHCDIKRERVLTEKITCFGKVPNADKIMTDLRFVCGYVDGYPYYGFECMLL